MHARLADTPLLLACAIGLALCVGMASRPADRPLMDLQSSEALRRVKASAPDEVTVVRPAGTQGVTVVCRPGKGEYPGVTITPEGAAWDLSAFGHVEATVTNTGTERLGVCLRIDDDGDWQQSPWNAETVYPAPGETATVRVRFGTSFGKPGYALKAGRVVRALVFISRPAAQQSFRILSLVAGGQPGEKPPVNPDDIRTKPDGGIVLGKGVTFQARQLEAPAGGGQLLVAPEGLEVSYAAGQPEAFLRVKPAEGRWDLRDWLQVVVRARNVGRAPVTLKARLESAPRTSPWVAAARPVPPGGAAEVTLPFAGPMVVLSATGVARGGSSFESDRASGVCVAADGVGERKLLVESVRAVVPPPAVPAWLGKRPPVPGDWRQTLAQEFDGSALDESKWTIYHPNYWDKRAHFSKQNVIQGGGVLRLRFEKKRGHENDDPARPETDWATGFITSTHKWTQRYGYFECRMKLPHAPGMWPAFWMMPDRGPAAGDHREDTENGGMEFDILEYLARYGPYRYNIACHWDGYGSAHKSTGTETLYVQPDKDGFFTAGLLWEPGRVTWYCNGAPIARWDDARVASVPEYILFTAVSGGWGGNELTGEGLPDDLVIDYVRVWQRGNWAALKP